MGKKSDANESNKSQPLPKPDPHLTKTELKSLGGGGKGMHRIPKAVGKTKRK